MKILPIQNNFYNYKDKPSTLKNGLHRPLTINVSNPINPLSKMYYQPTGFKGLVLDNMVIRPAAQKVFRKIGGIFDKKGYVDFSKLSIENLRAINFDITTATKNEITAIRAFIAHMEVYAKNPLDTGGLATAWPNIYHPYNVSTPLAARHFLADVITQQDIFAANGKALRDPNRFQELDVAIFDKKGNFTLNGIVFDTETTGTKPELDNVLQLGALVVKKGKVAQEYVKLVNPQMPIPPGASAVNGIYDKDVANAPTLSGISKEFLSKIFCKENGIIITCNGVKFDMPLFNRQIRALRLANGISQGHPLDKVINERPEPIVADIQILIQRIHPFLGSSKKLSHMYMWLFGKPMKDAHNALADCRATMPIFEYCCRVLDKSRIDKSKPLTLRQVLQFQNGEPEIENIGLHLDPVIGKNTAVDYLKSYRPEIFNFINAFHSYEIRSSVEEIGAANYRKLQEHEFIGEEVGLTYKGHKTKSAESKRIPGTNKKQTLAYEMERCFLKVLEIAEIEGYKGKSKEEIVELLKKSSMKFITSDDLKGHGKTPAKATWIKNVNPDDIPQGNDLPDDELTRKVMESAKTNGLTTEKK